MADRKVPCSVKGCPRTWLFKGSGEPPARMCDLCNVRAQTLADQQIGCATPDCKGSFTWTKTAQLEGIMRAATSKLRPGEKPPEAGPPKYMCEGCVDKAKALGTKEVPCNVAGCTRTWSFSGREQLAAGGVTPSRRCAPCEEKLADLRDQARPCSVRNCTRRWTWTKLEQLASPVAPERMCAPCAARVETLLDQEIGCKHDGCGGTWTWTKQMQLESPGGDPPARMCGGCQAKLGKLKDRAVPCARAGCRHTWPWKRAAQLQRWLEEGVGPETPPAPRVCDACVKALASFQDKQAPCKNAGCTQTFTWTPLAQLQAREAGHANKPAPQACDACVDFVKTHPMKTIVCASCGGGTPWSTELQLRTKLGQMIEPTICAACKRKQADVPRRQPTR